MLKKNFVRLLSLILAFSFLSLGANAKPNPKYASLVIDAGSGVVIHQKNAAKKRHPASLVKMMTLYMTFHALDRGHINLRTPLTVSEKAESQPPSKIGVKAGEKITVHDAILALSVKSANDVAVVLAENLGYTEAKFAKIMNRMARKLGMNSTYFKNASGLHHKDQVTNAYDMARLAIALRRDYKKYYNFFDKKSFTYKGKVFNSHNKVAIYYKGADGLKTGYINASGFNLVTSVKRSGESIIGVVMGGETAQKRDNHMVALLDNALYKLSGNIEFKNNKQYASAISSLTKKNIIQKKQYVKKQKLASLNYPKPNLKPSLSSLASVSKLNKPTKISLNKTTSAYPLKKPKLSGKTKPIDVSLAPSLKPNAS